MGDTTNVIAGAGQLYVAPYGTALPTYTSTIPNNAAFIAASWVQSGYTDDGVDFIYTPQYKDITVDEEMSAIDKLLIGEKLEVQIKMAETTLQNLNKAIGGSTLTLTTKSVLTAGSIAPANVPFLALAFVGPSPDGSQRLIWVNKVKAVAAVSFKYQRKDKMIYNVKWDALSDSAQSAGARLFTAIDYNTAGS